MTRKKRNLLGSAVILTFLVAGFLILKSRDEGTGEPRPELPKAAELVLLTDISPTSLRRVSVSNPKGGLSIISPDGERWSVVDEPAGFRPKENLMRSMVMNLSRLDGRLIEENSKDLQSYGLNPPVAEARLLDVDGNETVLFFGTENPTGNGRYATLSTDTSIYLAPATKANKAFWTPAEIREIRLPDVDPAQVIAATIRSDGRTFRTEPHTGELDAFRPLATSMDILEPWKSRQLLEDRYFQELLGSAPPPVLIAGFPDNPAIDPESVGLGDEADRIRLVSATGSIFDLEIGSADGDGRRYARERVRPDLIFLVDEDRLGLLDADPFGLMSNFVFLAGIDRVKRAEIEGKGLSFILEIDKLGDPEEDSDDTYYFNDNELSEKEFKDLYQLVIGLLYEGVAEEPFEPGIPEISITYTHADDSIPAKRILFYPYDDVYFRGVIENETSEFLIGRFQVRKMLESLTIALEE